MSGEGTTVIDSAGGSCTIFFFLDDRYRFFAKVVGSDGFDSPKITSRSPLKLDA